MFRIYLDSSVFSNKESPFIQVILRCFFLIKEISDRIIPQIEQLLHTFDILDAFST